MTFFATRARRSRPVRSARGRRGARGKVSRARPSPRFLPSARLVRAMALGEREAELEVSVVSSETRTTKSRRGGRRARGRDPTGADAVRARALARRSSRDASFPPPPARRARGTRARRPSYRPTPHRRLSEKVSFVTPPESLFASPDPHLPDRRRARTLEMWLALRNQRVKLHLFSGFVEPRSAPKRPARALTAPTPSPSTRFFPVASSDRPLT